MLMTALKMAELGHHFTAVHDSYWTHPADVEEMNEVNDFATAISLKFVLG
jgi:DNA-directed RNA polymerase